MITYDEMKAMAFPEVYTRPDGYFGDRCQVQFVLIGFALYEVHKSGYYRCPVIYNVQDKEELQWLIENHPNFKKYKLEV